jgi:hypothetical protein
LDDNPLTLVPTDDLIAEIKRRHKTGVLLLDDGPDLKNDEWSYDTWGSMLKQVGMLDIMALHVKMNDVGHKPGGRDD